jgi:hypothetical protein
MGDRLLLICEGPNDEAVGGALVERLIGAPGKNWNWETSVRKCKAFLYWREWKNELENRPRRMRGTLSTPESIKRLEHRGEALMAIKVVHMAQRRAPGAFVILMRDSDGKEQRVEAWRVFQQIRKSVIVGIAKESVEAWVLACWSPDEEEVHDASSWVKENRGTRFDPFCEPDRLIPRLSKRLLAYLNCVGSDDYADIVYMAPADQMRSKAAERVGLRQFVEQVEAKSDFIKMDVEEASLD